MFSSDIDQKSLTAYFSGTFWFIFINFIPFCNLSGIFFYKVKLWITFNEAFVVSWLGYGIAVFAPGVYSPDTGAYTVAHNIIRSHTRAYRTYETAFKAIQQGGYCADLRVYSFFIEYLLERISIIWNNLQ